jgi:hypothetical protein
MVAPATPKKERCARCGLAISRRRTPFVWHQHVVCEHCHGKLRAYEPAMAFCPGAKPVLRYARGGAADNRPHPGVARWMASVGRKLVGLR